MDSTSDGGRTGKTDVEILLKEVLDEEIELRSQKPFTNQVSNRKPLNSAWLHIGRIAGAAGILGLFCLATWTRTPGTIDQVFDWSANFF